MKSEVVIHPTLGVMESKSKSYCRDHSSISGVRVTTKGIETTFNMTSNLWEDMVKRYGPKAD